MSRCIDCHYGSPANLEDGLALECRRYPPQNIVVADEPLLLWPQVGHDDWCGEHRPPEGHTP